MSFDDLSKDILCLIGSYLKVKKVQEIWYIIPFYQTEEYWKWHFNNNIRRYKLYEIFDYFIFKCNLDIYGKPCLETYYNGHKLIKLLFNNDLIFEICGDVYLEGKYYPNAYDDDIGDDSWILLEQDALLSIACYRKNNHIIKLLLNSREWNKIKDNEFIKIIQFII
jgi:hypothetical protein